MPKKKAPPPQLPSPARKRRDKPLTSRKAGAPRRVPPDQVDPTFLTESELARRELFAQAYCAHGTLTASAEAAGYTGTKESLRKTGWRIYHEPAVQVRIAKIREDALKRHQITQDYVLSQYKRLADFDLGKCFTEDGSLKNIADIDHDTRQCLAGFEITHKVLGSGDDAMEITEKKVKAFSKTDALDKLRHQVGLATPQEKGEMTVESFIAALTAARSRALTPIEGRFSDPDHNGRTIEHQGK